MPSDDWLSGYAKGARDERRLVRKALRQLMDRDTPEMALGAIRGWLLRYSLKDGHIQQIVRKESS